MKSQNSTARIGLLVGLGVILVAKMWAYFSAPYIIGANIGAGLLGLLGMMIAAVCGLIFLAETFKRRKKE